MTVEPSRVWTIRAGGRTVAVATLVDLAEARTGEDLALLAPPERARAGRFAFERDRARFVARRATVRRVLGSTLGVPAARLRIERTPRGKPFLVDHDLRFSVSSCRDKLLIATGECDELGCDIETPRTGCDEPICSSVLNGVFGPAERARWEETAPDLRENVFVEMWTLKEAYGKAIGTGLSEPVHGFDTRAIGADPTVVACAEKKWLACSWKWVDDYRVAVVMSGSERVKKDRRRAIEECDDAT